LAAALVATVPRLATANSPGGATESSETAAGALDTVLVTAQRRSENVQDIGMAVSAFDADTLLAAGVTDAMQLQTVVPSLTYVATGYAAQPYLRGIGVNPSSGSSRRSLRISTTAT
jgi:iron complex outermembrane receptor protein